MGHIIDISHHQDPTKMNYDKLSAQLDLVIVRTQYGSRVIDKHYKTHHREFQKRGIPTAAYAWVRGISLNDMKVEAIDFYQRTKEFNPTFWFLDVEEESMKDMRAGVSAYVRALRNCGAKKVGIYVGHHLYKKFNLNLNEVDAIWIPHYGKNNGQVTSQPSFPCDIHQYTDKGRLEGYSGYLDLNRLMGTKPLEFFTGKEVVKVDKKDEIKKDKPSDWAKEAWEWAKKEGFLDGTRPKEPVTREELAVVLQRLVKKLG
ncbi:glycoside hydrolase family 25 protein [Tepidimicrobium xylanilyticum]|uniref:N-acetylmuramoyl-L-alanine amidase n=1 Tax=Tepidimicrobium xylanilyticum TaxID=1123352 RepID=A0A1H3FG39_9FIRM|nr:glycoside hydrolase family 25 protein [Tepidimicrobium xylanilyticum]SDX89910.1 N-acetylmuramoyl-L-alanine amidase [Tepidimicrobium xylanilyticum]